MADLSLFEFKSGDSALHRYDPRHKLVAFVFLAAALLSSAPVGLAGMCALLAAGLWSSRLPLAVLLRQLRGFLLFLFVTVFAKALSLPGEPLLPGLPLSLDGLLAGLLFAWRLLALVVAGLLFAGSSSVRAIGAALAWFLKPFPLIPAGRIATMLGLTLSFIPLLFTTYREVREAQVSRCSELRRNPASRAVALVIPLLVQSFARADAIVSAMEARCYSDERTLPSLRSRSEDWLLSALMISLSIAALSWPA